MEAQVSLLKESEVYIDLGDSILDKSPLQQALNKADADIVQELLSDTHVSEHVEKDGEQETFYVHRNFLSGFGRHPEEKRIRCLKAMIDCGLRLHELSDIDHAYHDCPGFWCIPHLYCCNTLDQLFESDFMGEYEMLLPYSRTFLTSVMTCGILEAATNGDYALSEYLAARISTMEDEAIIRLKEIADLKCMFLKPHLRYTALDCLLRAGVDPNSPHLSPTLTVTGYESPVEWAIKHHDFEYQAMLLSHGLAIDSAEALRSLFGKLERDDERVQPLSTRLWILRYLRGNGLDLRNHGMVALAAFLGYWSNSGYLNSDSILFRPLEETLTLLRFLLDAGADANMVIDKEGYTILHATVAARSASPALITALIEAGANVRAVNLDGSSVLNRAVESYKLPRGRSQRFSRLEIVECLLKHGAITTYQWHGSSILEELAIHAGFHFHPYPIDITEPFTLLFSQGAYVNNPNRESGPSALALLIRENMPSELIKMVLEAGADVNAPAVLTNGLYPIQAAVEADNIPVLMNLLNRGADINAPAARKNGNTALQLACLSRSGLLVQELLARGADVNAAAAYEGGLTALQVAEFAGKIDVAQIIIESGARFDLSPAAVNGNLPLDGAARMGRLDMVQYLMNLGAISQEPGTTRYDRAIKLAEKGGHYSVADMMREYASRLDEEQGREVNS